MRILTKDGDEFYKAYTGNDLEEIELELGIKVMVRQYGNDYRLYKILDDYSEEYIARIFPSYEELLNGIDFN